MVVYVVIFGLRFMHYGSDVGDIGYIYLLGIVLLGSHFWGCSEE